MKIELLYFGILRERLGCGREHIELPEDATVAVLLEALSERLGTDNRGAGAIRVAVNRDYAGDDCRLCDGDEVALIPPVSGG